MRYSMHALTRICSGVRIPRSLSRLSTPMVLATVCTHRSLTITANQNLFKAIQKEIEDEKRIEKKQSPTLPEGWTIQHSTGDGYFTLCKPEKGVSPRCEVFCSLPKLAQDSSDEPTDQYPFILRMCRNNKTIEYSMVSVENELVVDNIMVYSGVRKIDDFLNADISRKLEASYQGPTLAHLDESLISALHEFLEENSINDKFAQYVKEQCEYIEQEEYERWLTELQAFSK